LGADESGSRQGKGEEMMRAFSKAKVNTCTMSLGAVLLKGFLFPFYFSFSIC